MARKTQSEKVQSLKNILEYSLMRGYSMDADPRFRNTDSRWYWSNKAQSEAITTLNFTYGADFISEKTWDELYAFVDDLDKKLSTLYVNGDIQPDMKTSDIIRLLHEAFPIA